MDDQLHLFMEILTEQTDHVLKHMEELVAITGIEGAKRQVQEAANEYANRINDDLERDGQEDFVDCLILISLMAGGLLFDLRLDRCHIDKLAGGKFTIRED